MKTTNISDNSIIGFKELSIKKTVHYIILTPILASLLTACGSDSESEKSTNSLPDNSSSFTIDIESLVQNSDGIFRAGYFYPKDTITSYATQHGDLFIVEGSRNHLLVDLRTGEARFYEVLDSDYSQVANYSGLGSLSFSSNELSWDDYLYGQVTYENELPIDIAFKHDDQKQFPDTNSLESISNTYTQRFGPYPDFVNISITIDEDGLLTGATDSGCIFNGMVSIPEMDNNSYYVEAEVSNCDEAGIYQGLSYLEEHSTNNITNLNLHLFSKTYSLFFKLNN